jgi:hypothetical protein
VWDYVELDKAGGAWLMTAFPDIALCIALRLRTSDFHLLGEEFTVHCELRAAGETEFRAAYTFETDGLRR